MYILEDVVLPVNMKIKAIRKFLRINQKELAGDVIDRSLISYIENGKVKLTNETANILANNLKKILKERNLNYKVEADYLLADEEQQVGYKLDTYINNIRKFIDNDGKFQEYLTKAEKLLESWDIPLKRAVIYDIAGDFYYTKKSMDECRICYLKSIESYARIPNYEMIAAINTKLARCAFKKEDYEEVIYLNNYALNMLNNNNINNVELTKRILFNNSLAYNQLKMHKKSLSLLEELTVKFNDFTPLQVIDILMLKGINLKDIGNYEDAMETYKKVLLLLRDYNNLEITAKTYTNISELYKKLNQLDKSIEFDIKSLQIREKINSESILLNLMSLADKYIIINKIGMAEKYLLKALDKAEEGNNITLQIEIYGKLMDVYLKYTNNISKLGVVQDIYEFVESNRDVSGIENIVLKLCTYYLDKDIKMIERLLRLSPGGLTKINANIN